jgi:hypothetical protein
MGMWNYAGWRMRLRVVEANYLMCNVVAKIKKSIFLVHRKIPKVQILIQKITAQKGRKVYVAQAKTICSGSTAS